MEFRMPSTSKKDYVAPEIKVIALKQQAPLLGSSSGNSDPFPITIPVIRD